MAGFFSPSSSPLSSAVSANQGFSEIGGAAQPINVVVSGKVGKRNTISPIINLTDQGAINAALEVSQASLRGIDQFGSRVEDLLTQAFAALGAQSKQTIEAVSSANRSETENLGLAALKWGALVAGGFLVVRGLAVMK